MKMTQMIEIIKEDVNKEESKTLEIFSTFLRSHFKLALLTGIPFLLYLLFSFGNLH